MYSLNCPTTTIASSTTRPIASTNANSDNVFIEKPNMGTRDVPTSETAPVIGIRVARQFVETEKRPSDHRFDQVVTISLIPS